MDAGGPRTAAAEQGHAAAHSCGSLRGHACGGGADPQYQRQTAGATVDAPTAARRVAHARRLVPTPAHAAKVHKPAWASTQKRGQLPMRWSSESGKKTCSQVDASTEAGFMHSYVVGHIGPDPSQPSILRNGDRGRRESSRQVTTPYRCHVVAEYSPEYFRDFDPGGGPICDDDPTISFPPFPGPLLPFPRPLVMPGHAARRKTPSTGFVRLGA